MGKRKQLGQLICPADKKEGDMGMGPDGNIRMMEENEEPKQNESIFKLQEVVTLKGKSFRIINIFPYPRNEIVLKGMDITDAMEKYEELKEKLQR